MVENKKGRVLKKMRNATVVKITSLRKKKGEKVMTNMIKPLTPEQLSSTAEKRSREE